jgi:hypothetical protein
MRIEFVLIVSIAGVLLAGCREEQPLPDAIVGKWINDADGGDTLELRDDGSLQINGPRRHDRVRGNYKFIDEDNIEMKFRFADGAEAWHPKWMPPGLLRDPLMRAHVQCTGDSLELRPRGRVKADNIDQFIEFPTIRYNRAPEIEAE